MTTDALLDGAVLIQMLCPGSAVIIRDYFTDVFAPCILSRFERSNWLDIVPDVYSKTSLKSRAWEQRGSGTNGGLHSQPKFLAIGLPSFVLI